MSQQIETAPIVDLDALLVALVLVPHSYPRNRFFDLFKSPAAHEVRRRAALLRSVIADLVGEAEQIAITHGHGKLTLSYHLPDVGVRRTTMLHDTELALVKYGVDRVRTRDDLCADDDAVASIAPLLTRLYR